MIEGSQIARPLTAEEVNKIWNRHFPNRKLTSFTALKGGLFNNTVRLDFSDAPSVILRAGPVRPELLLPYELHLMDAEAEVDRLCEDAGIPCSHVLALDTSKTMLDRDYMLVECIDSLPLCDPSIPPEAKPLLYRQTGHFLSQFHQIQGQSFGRVYDVIHGNGYKSWGEALLRELEDISRMLLEADLMEGSVLSDIHALLEENLPLLELQKPLLTHTDIWEGNILVRQSGNSWEVAAIIDGDRAYFGDPDFDMATPWMMTPDFLEGYGKIPPDSPARQKKLRIYRMFLNLAEAYIWEKEYQNHQAYLDKKTEVETALREIPQMKGTKS